MGVSFHICDIQEVQVPTYYRRGARLHVSPGPPNRLGAGDGIAWCDFACVGAERPPLRCWPPAGSDSVAPPRHGVSSTPSSRPLTAPPLRRFLLPALQLAIPSSAAGLELLLSPSHRRRRQLRRAAAFVCLLLQAAAASYLSLVHQRGAVSVMDVLASKARGGGGLSAVFLMPCHSTPFHSHVHSRGAAMAFLDCSPPGWAHKTHELNALPGGEGEGRCQPRLLRASDFDADPVGFTRRLLAAGEAAGGGGEGGPLGACPLPPGHVVTFDAVGEVLRPLLEGLGYREVARLFQSHFTVDHNGLQRSVLVYERLHAP